MAGFEDLKDELAAESISVFGASSDDLEHAQEVQRELSFPIAYGVTKDLAATLGSWWEDRRGIVQPSEFIIDTERKVLSATYSTGPIGRINAEDVLKLIRFYKKQAAKS